jgi:anaerobic C4-dicarboxylate transporter
LTSFNIYPINLYVQFVGVLGWLVVGVKTKDNALVFVNGVGLAILGFGIVYSQSL